MLRSCSVLCLYVLEIILLCNNGIFCQNDEHVMKQLQGKGAMGLDDDFKLKNCSSSMDCTFLFLCPKNYTFEKSMCTLRQSTCPSVSTLSYTIYPFHRIIDLPNKTLSNNYSAGKTKTCRYNVDGFTSSGNATGNFNLTFDVAENTLTLNVSSNVGEEYIKCYAEHRVTPIHRITDLNDNLEDDFSYYSLELDAEPLEYYCYVDAPSIFKPKITERVFAYAKSSHKKYILKAIVSNFDYSTLRSERCAENDLYQCKLVRIDPQDTFYYFFRDELARNIGSVKNLIANIVKNVSSEDLNIEYIRNIDYCEAGITESLSNDILHWEQTLLATMVTSQELCLDNNGKQATRKCIGSFLKGAHWNGSSSYDCSRNFEASERIQQLHQFINTSSVEKTFSNITAETECFRELTPVDVDLLSKAFATAPLRGDAPRIQEDFYQSIENIIRVDGKVLKASQDFYNSTDRILDAVDSYSTKLAQETTSNKNISYIMKSNILVQTTYPAVSKIIGLALYNDNGSANFSEYEIINLYENDTFENLNLINLELAMYLPKELVQDLMNRLPVERRNEFNIINTIFYNDSLFNEVGNVKRHVGSRIINISIPGFESKLNGSIPILFQPTKNANETDCVYWDYGEQKTGRWSKRGGRTVSNNNNHKSSDNPLTQCSFTHLTHFALLVLSENSFIIEKDGQVIGTKNPMDPHDAVLTVITLIGCSFSVVGIVGILITVIVFKGWYIRRLNSIQLSIIMLLEIFVLFLADNDDLKEGGTCKTVAIILHYVVLAKFTWMLLIGRLQYLKFVKILPLAQLNSHTWVYNLLGWILPAIPVAVSALIFPNSYTSGISYFCYVKDYSLYLFLILPASITILTNVVVFVMIMINVSNSKCQDYGTSIYKLQIRLAILLFFMLGITWIFGIVGEILPMNWAKLSCIYLFCMLASIQGFAMFVFNVILDLDTRCFWKDWFLTKGIHLKK